MFKSKSLLVLFLAICLVPKIQAGYSWRDGVSFAARHKYWACAISLVAVTAVIVYYLRTKPAAKPPRFPNSRASLYDEYPSLLNKKSYCLDSVKLKPTIPEVDESEELSDSE